MAAKVGLVAGRASPPIWPPAHPWPRRCPFWGATRLGIVTPQQRHTYLASLDLVAKDRAEVIAMLRAVDRRVVADVARRKPAAPIEADLGKPAADSGEARDLPPSRLGLYPASSRRTQGADQYGPGREGGPRRFVDLPKFNGDQSIECPVGGGRLPCRPAPTPPR